MLPDHLFHLIHIFVSKNFLPATRLFNEGVIMEGMLVIVEDLITTAIANIVSPEDILFKEKTPYTRS